jgi:hypothetical protein
MVCEWYNPPPYIRPTQADGNIGVNFPFKASSHGRINILIHRGPEIICNFGPSTTIRIFSSNATSVDRTNNEIYSDWGIKNPIWPEFCAFLSNVKNSFLYLYWPFLSHMNVSGLLSEFPFSVSLRAVMSFFFSPIGYGYIGVFYAH